MTRFLGTTLAVVFTAALFAHPAAAQQTAVTTDDIQRLQDNVYLAERDISQLRSRDSTRAEGLQTELDQLRDEVIYLKVKLRKERSLNRNEFADVRDRIDGVRSRARATSTASAPPAAAPPAAAPVPSAPATRSPSVASPSPSPSSTRSSSAASEIPAGTEFDVRLQTGLNSGTAQVEQRFEGTTLVDVMLDERVVIPAGTVVRGMVSAVEPATRTNRTARMTVVFDELMVNGRSYPIRGTVTEAIEGEGIKGEAVRIGAGAGVGAVIGGLLGGVKGALAGVLIGGGGTIAATEGKEVELPQGSVLRVRLDSPLVIDRRR
jgi:hypothetical protein